MSISMLSTMFSDWCEFSEGVSTCFRYLHSPVSMFQRMQPQWYIELQCCCLLIMNVSLGLSIMVLIPSLKLSVGVLWRMYLPRSTLSGDKITLLFPSKTSLKLYLQYLSIEFAAIHLLCPVGSCGSATVSALCNWTQTACSSISNFVRQSLVLALGLVWTQTWYLFWWW